MLVEIERGFTPPELAKLMGIQSMKIIGWIRSGELRAINLATKRGGRSRWRIKAADWAAFEEARTAKPPTRPMRRPRRSNPPVKNYFPDDPISAKASL